VQVDRDTIIELLKSRGEHDKAEQAQSELPGKVDLDQHADLLAKLGIDPQDLVGKLGGLGGLGGLG
jgi:hypothetical protein